MPLYCWLEEDPLIIWVEGFSMPPAVFSLKKREKYRNDQLRSRYSSSDDGAFCMPLNSAKCRKTFRLWILAVCHIRKTNALPPAPRVVILSLSVPRPVGLFGVMLAHRNASGQPTSLSGGVPSRDAERENRRLSLPSLVLPTISES